MARRKKSLGGAKWFCAPRRTSSGTGPLWAYEAFMRGHYDNNHPWKK